MDPGTSIDWLTVAASFRDVFLVAGGATLAFLGTMFTLREQGKRLDQQLKAHKEIAELELQARKEAQLRDKQLVAVGEVSALLELAFKESDQTLIEGALGIIDNSPEAATGQRSEETRLLAHHKVLLPPHLASLAIESSKASRAYGSAFLNFAIDEKLAARVQKQPQDRFVLAVQCRHDALNDPVVSAHRQKAADSVEAYQSAASEFANAVTKA